MTATNFTSPTVSHLELCREPTSTSFVAQSCFLILIAITTLLGNLSVCLTVLFNSNLHTFTSYLVASLACSDLMVATFSLPFRIHQTLHNTYWCLSEDACLFWIWADLFCCCASIGNLALISIDRFLATKYPLRYHQIVTKKTSWVMLSSVWIYSFIVASSGLTNWTYPTGMIVGIDNGCYKPDPYFYTFAAVVGFFFPLVVIICAYGYIFKIAMEHFRAISRLTTPVQPSVPQRSESHQTLYKQQLKATKTLAIVVGAFVICWLPTFIILLVQTWCQTCLNTHHNPELSGLFYFINIAFVYTLPNINSAINPFIYVVFSKDLRQAFIKTFRSLYQDLCDIRARRQSDISSFS
ncbi:alpha-1A adrenergic receptor-like [Oculina patagonica]